MGARSAALPFDLLGLFFGYAQSDWKDFFQYTVYIVLYIFRVLVYFITDLQMYIRRVVTFFLRVAVAIPLLKYVLTLCRRSGRPRQPNGLAGTRASGLLPYSPSRTPSSSSRPTTRWSLTPSGLRGPSAPISSRLTRCWR